MEPLVTREECLKAEEYTIHTLQISELILMEHAGLSVLDRLKKRFGNSLPKTKGFVLAGKGNNGGDALSAARQLLLDGFKNFEVCLSQTGNLSQSNSHQKNILEKLGVNIHPFSNLKITENGSYDWVIDGLFGIGLKNNVDGTSLEMIDYLNKLSHSSWVISVDIPSGLSSDFGNPMPRAVRANETVSLGFLKRGLVTGRSADYVGKISLYPIQIPRAIPSLEFKTFLFQHHDATLKERSPSGHKGNYGHLYCWVGEENKEGAGLLSALGALKTGVGLTTLIGTNFVKKARDRFPLEIMVEEGDSSMISRLENKTLVLGPGMGLQEKTVELISRALLSSNALILDGDALTHLASHEEELLPLLLKRKNASILTPHPKEASRLLKTDVESIEGNRFKSLSSLVEKYRSTIILKGKGSLIGHPGKNTLVVQEGDSSLSKGGSGDLLSGILGSLVAQGIEPYKASASAVYILGRASEAATEKLGQTYSSSASEIANFIPNVLKQLSW